MKKFVYGVFDKVSGQYGVPVMLDEVPNMVVAVCRWFDHGLSNIPADANRVASDYDLFEFGMFDPVTGQFDLFEKPKFMVSGCVKKEMPHESSN